MQVNPRSRRCLARNPMWSFFGAAAVGSVAAADATRVEVAVGVARRKGPPAIDDFARAI